MQLGAADVFLVHIAALQIIGGDGGRLEITGAVDGAYIMLHLVKLRHSRTRHLSPHDLALGGIVVHEYEALRQQRKLLRHLDEIHAFRLPIRLDRNEIVGLQDHLRVIQPRHGVVALVLRHDVQEYPLLLKRFQIALELGVDLSHGGVLSNFNSLHAVVAHNAAPECVIKVKGKGLLVFAENALDDVRDIKSQRRNSVKAERVFVHMPVERIAPLAETVVGGLVVDVVDEEVVVALGVVVQARIEPCDEVDAPTRVKSVAVAEQPEEGIFKVVLDDGAMIALRQRLPHRLKMGVLAVKARLHGGGIVRRVWPVGDIAIGGVDKYHIRRKRGERRVVKHRVLEIFTVFRLVERRAYALPQQEKLQHIQNVMRCRASEHGDMLFRKPIPCRKLAPYRLALAHKQLRVKGIFDQGRSTFFHHTSFLYH